VLLSSLSAHVGGVGLAGYAAANCFLDAVAAQRNQQGGTPWVSINWDVWHFPAGEEADEPSAGANVILPEEGEMPFEAILARAPRQVVVSPRPLRTLYEEAVSDHSVPASASSERAAPRRLHSRPELATEYCAPRSAIEAEIVDMWQQLLGVGPIGIN